MPGVWLSGHSDSCWGRCGVFGCDLALHILLEHLCSFRSEACELFASAVGPENWPNISASLKLTGANHMYYN